jgi:hypothetical protein
MNNFSTSIWIAGIILIFLMGRGAWRGYKRGPMRQLAGPFALTVGLFVGWTFGKDVGHSLLHGTSFPWLLRGVAGITLLTCATGLFIYGIIWWLGKKPTGADEAESPVMGAMVGCWTGLLYFSVLVIALCSTAAIVGLVSSPRPGTAHWSVATRDELAELPYAGWIKDWSPLPDRQKNQILLLKTIMGDPAAQKRLIAAPEIRALSTHPSLYQALEDKKVRELLNNKDLSGLFENQKVRSVLADEQLQRQAESIDLESVMRRALIAPEKPQK